MNENHKKDIKNQKGSVLIIVAMMLIVLLGLTAMGVDVGHIYKVRNELQNAADAAALAGANYLYPPSSNGSPNWSLAETHALKLVQKNMADTTQLSTATVTPGYWNISGTPAGLESVNITPGGNDLVAIQVTITKTAGQNGGPVQLFFGPVLGIKTMDVSATAVAVVGSPTTVPAGTLFPLTLSQTTYNTYWNSNNNQPVWNENGNAPSFQCCQKGSTTGCWTTFGTNSYTSSTIKSCISTGNPTQCSVGDSICVAPSSSNEVFSNCPSNVDCICPIVSDCSSQGTQQVLGYGCVHIVQSVSNGGHGQSSENYVQCYLNSYVKVENTNATGYGVSYGVYTSSKLAN